MTISAAPRRNRRGLRPQEIASGSRNSPTWSNFQAVVLSLLLLYPVFGQIAPTGVVVVAYAAATCLITYWFIGSRGWARPGMGVSGPIWVTLGLYALVSQGITSEAFSIAVAIFAISMALMLMVSTATGWSSQAVTVTTGFLLAHALATLMFYISPGLFDSLIRPRFFQDSSLGIDFRTSLTSNAGYNAMFCALGFILVSVRLIVGQHERRSLFVLRALAVVFLIALLLTAKRAHPLYAVVTVLLVYLASHASGKWLRLLGGLTVGSVVLFWAAGASEGIADSVDRFMRTFDALDLREATSGRTFLWEEAIEGWRQALVFGNGWDSFYVVWPHGRTESFVAHNQILNSLYESGLAGTLIFAIGAAVAVLVSYRTMRALMGLNGQRDALTAATASFALQAYLLLYALTGGELLSNPYTFVPYFFAIAMGYSALNSLSGDDLSVVTQFKRYPNARSSVSLPGKKL